MREPDGETCPERPPLISRRYGRNHDDGEESRMIRRGDVLRYVATCSPAAEAGQSRCVDLCRTRQTSQEGACSSHRRKLTHVLSRRTSGSMPRSMPGRNFVWDCCLYCAACRVSSTRHSNAYIATLGSVCEPPRRRKARKRCSTNNSTRFLVGLDGGVY